MNESFVWNCKTSLSQKHSFVPYVHPTGKSESSIYIYSKTSPILPSNSAASKDIKIEDGWPNEQDESKSQQKRMVPENDSIW